MDAEMLEVLQSFILESSLILIPVLYVIGYAIKQTDCIKDKYIPILLMTLGVLVSIFNGGLNVASVLQGFLVGGATIGTHEVVKQTAKDE